MQEDMPPPKRHQGKEVTTPTKRYSAASSSSTLEVLPSIEEFRTWGQVQVVDFFEPILTEFSKDDREKFVKSGCDGVELEGLTIMGFAERGVMTVVKKIMKDGGSNSKRKSVSCEPDTGDAGQI